jgi:DNA-directed RNA polymerase specialized sigma24 family protein
MAKRYDHASMGGSAREFPPTEWTRILAGRQSEAVLAELCRKYWKPVYCYLRSMGLGNDEAKDLTQGFFTDKVLGQDLIQKADREKGRFRSFLLRSVHNYAVSAVRSSKVCSSLDDASDIGTTTDEAEVQFNRTWADELLQEVLTELEQECRSRDKLTHWQVFHEWLLEPQIAANPVMSEICVKYGISDPATAYHMVENIKRRFRALLRDHLGSLTRSEDEIEVEIRQFIDVFSAGPART